LVFARIIYLIFLSVVNFMTLFRRPMRKKMVYKVKGFGTIQCGSNARSTSRETCGCGRRSYGYGMTATATTTAATRRSEASMTIRFA
jgi:hypothetical protein